MNFIHLAAESLKRVMKRMVPNVPLTPSTLMASLILASSPNPNHLPCTLPRGTRHCAGYWACGDEQDKGLMDEWVVEGDRQYLVNKHKNKRSR